MTLALLPGLAVAAEETRELDDFDTVHFVLPYEVEFVQSDEPYLTLEGDEDAIADVKTRMKGGTLKIYKDNGSWFNWGNGEPVVITVGYTELEGINMAGSGDGYAEVLDNAELELKITGSANLEVDEVQADNVQISIAGSGNVQLNEVDVDTLTARIAGSGDIRLEGRAVTQKVSIAGSGDFRAQELRTQETDASIRGSGDIRVWAETQLAIDITGSGDLRYYGTPSVTERIVGSGDIVRMGDAP